MRNPTPTPNETHEMGTILEAYYQAPQPSPEFLAGLEAQLINASQAAPMPSRTNTLAGLAARLFSGPRARWTLAPAAFIAGLLVVVLILGPQQVLAQVQSWLRYVPGYGFVDANAVRALAQPISQTQGAATLTIKQVLAQPGEETHVVIHLEGYTEDDFTTFMGVPTPENNDERLKILQALFETDARLILPDGTVIASTAFGAAPWDGFYIFPELPRDVLSARFEVTRLAGVPAGVLPEGWSFDLVLEYMDDPEVVELPEPVWVNAASEPVHGVRTRVLDAVYAQTEISLRVQLEDLPTGWEPLHNVVEGELTDNLGDTYPVIYGPVFGLGPDGVFTNTYQPLDPAAAQATFTIPYLYFRAPLDGQFIPVDFGTSPQVGDWIPLDAALKVLEIPVRVTGVEIQETKNAPDGNGGTVSLITYAFELQATQPGNGIDLWGLEFAPDAIRGTRFTTASSGSRSDPDNPAQIHMILSIGYPAEHPILSGLQTFPIAFAQVRITGPYTITWLVER